MERVFLVPGIYPDSTLKDELSSQIASTLRLWCWRAGIKWRQRLERLNEPSSCCIYIFLLLSFKSIHYIFHCLC